MLLFVVQFLSAMIVTGISLRRSGTIRRTRNMQLNRHENFAETGRRYFLAWTAVQLAVQTGARRVPYPG
jgi:hypothetical protein